MPHSIHFIYASTSGHTEFVIETLRDYILKNAPSLEVELQKAELAKAEDLLRGDYIVLGSGTWNTGGIEGQLNVHMDALLNERAAAVDLQGKPFTSISLGDERYYFRTRSTEHILRFVREHHGTLFLPPFVLVNEPFDQQEKIEQWGQKLVEKIGL